MLNITAQKIGNDIQLTATCNECESQITTTLLTLQTDKNLKCEKCLKTFELPQKVIDDLALHAGFFGNKRQRLQTLKSLDFS